MTSRPRVSVVIPSYRADRTLPRVLAALGHQIDDQTEVLIVDSSGWERTPQLQQEHPWLQVVHPVGRLYPGQARNLGARRARGALLAFLDADAIPRQDWLNNLEQALRPELDAVVGAVLNGTPHSRIGTAEYLLNFSETFPGRARALRHAPSVNLLVRRDAFLAAGGFDERLRAGEDTVLTFPWASQGRLGLATEAKVEHINRIELRPFLANQQRQGRATVAIYRTLPYPNRWLCRSRAFPVAGPLRLLALGRILLHNRVLVRDAALCLPQLVIGTMAWTAGLYRATRPPARS